MQIHELNKYTGNLDSGAYLGIDNGTDTGKVSVTDLLKDVNDEIEQAETDLNGRIDNIIAGGTAPSEAEVTDARLGANGVTYPSLGDAIRTQVNNLHSEIIDTTDAENETRSFTYSDEIVLGALQTYSMYIDTTSTQAIACTKKTPCTPGERVQVVMPDVDLGYATYYRYRFGWYRADGTNIEQIAYTNDDTLTIPANSAFFSFGVFLYNTSTQQPIMSPALYDILPSDEMVRVKFLDRYTDHINEKLTMKKRMVDIQKSQLVTGSLQVAAFIVDTSVLHAVTYLHKIPAKAEETFTIEAPEIEGVSYRYRAGFYDSTGTALSQVTRARFNTLKTPENCAYIAICCFAHDAQTGTEKIGYNLLDHFSADDIIKITFNEDLLADYTTSEEVDEAIKTAIEPTEIVPLNLGLRDKLLQAKRPINLSSYAYLSETQPVVLLHFSDIHGDEEELSRMMEIKEEYSNMIDDAICTGDLVRLRYSNGIAFWNNVAGAEDTLIVIGNHDVLADEQGYDFDQRVSQATQYSTFLAPYIANWGVTYQNGKTYYYKDYAAKKMRLIVLNCMLEGSDNSDQLTWFISTLASARTAGYSVLVSNHYMIAGAEKIACNFTSIDKGVGTDVLPSEYLDAVQEFINDGGKFVCHLVGHTHNDLIVRNETYNNQLCVVIDALNREQGNQYSDTQRTDGTRSQDLANMFIVDTASQVIKIIRVGANMDHYLRAKNCITIRYTDGIILSQN